MKRNQVIAAMQALPEDCDAEFAVVEREKMIDIIFAKSNFILLASEVCRKDYQIDDWRGVLVDVFSMLGQRDKAKAVVCATAIEFNKMGQTIDEVIFDSIAKLAMR